MSALLHNQVTRIDFFNKSIVFFRVTILSFHPVVSWLNYFILVIELSVRVRYVVLHFFIYIQLIYIWFIYYIQFIFMQFLSSIKVLHLFIYIQFLSSIEVLHFFILHTIHLHIIYIQFIYVQFQSSFESLRLSTLKTDWDGWTWKRNVATSCTAEKKFLPLSIRLLKTKVTVSMERHLQRKFLSR